MLRFPLPFKIFLGIMTLLVAWVLFDGISPWGSGAENARIVARLNGKCVENIAGGRGVVSSVDHVGAVLVVFTSGVKEQYREAELKVVTCGAS